MRTAALLLVAMLACSAIAPAYSKESVPVPPNVNCNRTCWNYPGLESLKSTLFKLCRANARITETKPGE